MDPNWTVPLGAVTSELTSDIVLSHLYEISNISWALDFLDFGAWFSLIPYFVSKYMTTFKESIIPLAIVIIAPDKDWRQLGIYPPLFDLIGYFKF